MDTSDDSSLRILIDEKIEPGDILLVDGQIREVMPAMVGKSTAEAGELYYVHAGLKHVQHLISPIMFFRPEDTIKCLDSAKRVRVYVNYNVL